MNKRALVSIIITTRNNQATLDACLQSINDQTYSPIELIIVDNASTDKTKQIAKKFTKYVYNKGPERSAQRNYGVSKAKGDYVLITDSDMVLPPQVISECMEAINKENKSVIIPEISFGEGFWAKCKTLERSFYNGVDWIEAPRFFSKKIYQEAGGYDENMSGGEDWDLCNRIHMLTKVTRTVTPIRHNEGNPTLKSIVGKRRYYAKGFNDYYNKKQTKNSSRSPTMQALGTYGLFISKPIKLFKQPGIAAGMLTMKTIEFGVLATNRYTSVKNKESIYE